MTNRFASIRRLTVGLFFAAVLLPAYAPVASSPPAAAPAPAQVSTQGAATGRAANVRIVEGRVVAVADGDTITVLGEGDRQTRVRLQGIDAPESRQAFGAASKRHLGDLVFDRRVTVEYEKTDRYGRTLGKVLVGGRDVNLEQVKSGLAWHYKYYEDEQSPEDRRLYAEAEAGARAAGRGLWADANPTPPWDFRRGARSTGGEREGGSSVEGRKRAGPEEQPAPSAGRLIGNRRSMIYHRPDCPSYSQVSPSNRVYFDSPAEAERAGYRLARNCP